MMLPLYAACSERISWSTVPLFLIFKRFFELFLTASCVYINMQFQFAAKNNSLPLCLTSVNEFEPGLFFYCNPTENFLQYHTNINYIKNNFFTLYCFKEINNCLHYLQCDTTNRHMSHHLQKKNNKNKKRKTIKKT